MARTSTYDVIVVGHEPAAMMCAGLLQRMRYRVLWIGQGGLKDHYGADSDRLPALPWMLPPYGQGPALDQVLSELKVEDPVHQLGDDGGDPKQALQIITPTRRLDLLLDPEHLAKELDRAWPEASREVTDFARKLINHEETLRSTLGDLPHLPPESLRDKGKAKRLAEKMKAVDLGPQDQWPWLWRLLAQATTFGSHLDEEARGSGVTSHLMTSMLRGLRLVPDLCERLQKALAKAGVECEAKAMVKELLIEGRQVVGVETTRSGTVFKASVLVAGMPLAELTALVPPKMRRRKFRLLSESVRPQLSVFCVDLVVPKSALPLGLGKQVLLVRDVDGPWTEDGLIHLRCLPHPHRRDRIQLNLSCLVPYHKSKLGREYLGPLQQSMVTQSAKVIPFLEENMEGMTSPFWEARAADTGHPSAWLLHRTLETDLPISMGMAVLPMPLAYKNLLLCGPEAMPGLGIEGQAQAALQVTRWIKGNKRLKKIL